MTAQHPSEAIANMARRCEKFVESTERLMRGWIDPAAKAQRLEAILAGEQIIVPFATLATAVRHMEASRWALFKAAPHHQGGHSSVGAMIAEALDVQFPISWPDLVGKLRAEGVNPAMIYPDLVTMSPALFSSAEVAEAVTARPKEAQV